MQKSGVVLVELNSQASQPPDSIRARGGYQARDAFVYQSRADSDRVGGVLRRVVSGAEGRGYAALGPFTRPGSQRGLRYDDASAEAERSGQTGDAGPDDDGDRRCRHRGPAWPHFAPTASIRSTAFFSAAGDLGVDLHLVLH